MTDRGSATVAAVGVAAVVLVLTAGLAAVGQLLHTRAVASAAADAAALAAAPVTFRPFGAEGSPADEARRLAIANGGQLVSCRCEVDRSYATRTVVVEVRVDMRLLGLRPFEVAARSAAEFRPVDLLTG